VAITSSGLGHPDTLPVSTCDEAAPSTNNHNKQSAHHYQQQTENPKTATQSPTATSQDANDSLSSKHDSELIVSNPDPEAIEKAPRCIIRGLFQIQKRGIDLILTVFRQPLQFLVFQTTARRTGRVNVDSKRASVDQGSL
jgi:hypothetical protein